MRGTMVRRTGIIRNGGQHVWSLHVDTDGTPYGVCTLHERGAYKYVSTTMGPGDHDAPAWLTDVLAAHGPANEYERAWLEGCGALVPAEAGSSSLAFLACTLVALVPVSLVVVFVARVAGAVAGVMV